MWMNVLQRMVLVITRVSTLRVAISVLVARVSSSSRMATPVSVQLIEENGEKYHPLCYSMLNTGCERHTASAGV